ncbi:hypothetical protein CkaCkLH20_05308 [Colletotrichum karsti]|uniref:Uncharacterized protein n=1 Tax=Colletotrichum karsti TaxID=1095194 RepID=A0A9P6I789_9PEZI|nr:uncharacterized protein CkaCkLH20_05308 [Colletotrichum karsti]KAF9877042.1 hypothetical protein CkaCkLH20_05308 [Colletotrichum karsti]
MLNASAENPPDCLLWSEALAAKFDGVGEFGKDKWDALLGHCQAVCDWPAASFAEELIDAYPDAKVLLTTRDVDKWYNSAIDTVNWRANDTFLWALSFVDWASSMYYPMLNKYWTTIFKGDFEKNGKEVFLAHNEHIRKLVPADNLLEFRMSDGWEPLCKFLGCPVPNTPFPYVNEVKESDQLKLSPEIWLDIIEYASRVRKSELDESKGQSSGSSKARGKSHGQSLGTTNKGTRDLNVLKALRLTSKTLCDLSSPLLFNTVSVGLSTESLARLETMSRNPSIATSVRCVRVNLAFYAEDLAQSWEAFRAYRAEMLGAIEERFRILLDELRDDVACSSQLKNHVRRLGASAAAHKIYDFSASQVRKARWKQMLAALHKLERSETENVLKPACDFARKVAQCVAKMPKVASLEISDLDIDLDWDHHEDKANSLSQHATAPMRWEKYDMTKNCKADEVPIAILLELPLELAKSGLALTKLSISVSASQHQDWDKLNLSSEMTTELANLAGDLKQLEIMWWSPNPDIECLGHPSDVATYNKQTKVVGTFISQILSLSPSLEKLRLCATAFDFSGWRHWEDRDEDYVVHKPSPLASCIGIPLLTQLKRLELDHFNTNVEPLANLIGSRPFPITVRLDNITILKPDNLHAALNMLRSKADPNQQQLGNSPTSPVYVESLFAVRDLEYLFRRKERDLNTGNSRWIEDYEKSPASPAIKYVRWQLDRNPVRNSRSMSYTGYRMFSDVHDLVLDMY